MEETYENKTIVPVSAWKKFRLLMWKNLQIQLNYKLEFLIQVVVTISLSCVLIVLRNNYSIYMRPKFEYQPLAINNLDPFRETIQNLHADQMPIDILIYSPKNEFLDKIIEGAANKLGIEHKASTDSKSLMETLRRRKFLAGLLFEDYLSELTTFPKKIRYDMLVPTDLRSHVIVTMRPNKIWGHFLANIRGDMPMHWFTETSFMFSPFGPRNSKDNDGGLPGSYWREGLIAIQHAIACSYIELIGPTNPIPEVVLQRYPYPPLTADALVDILREVMPLLVMGCFLTPIFCITKKTCREKDRGMKVILIALGVSNWIQWLASFTFSFILILIHLVPLVLMMRIPLSSENGACYNFADPSAILFAYIIYGVTCICFCFLMGVIFKSPLVASVTASLIYVLSIVSTENYDYISLKAKMLMCIDFNMALSFLVIIIGRHELGGTGFQWSEMFTPASPEDYLSVGLVLVMLLLDAAVFFLLALYFEQLYPGEYGVPQKWNFLFQANYWHCEWRGRQYIDAETTDTTFYAEDDDDDGFDLGDAEYHSKNIENDPVRKQLMIELRQLVKKFGSKTVIHELTINVFASEITVLLGHPGAGKTTIIRMMMGILPPTDGTVHINNRNMHSDPKLPRSVLGICPQINSLFVDLTVRNQLVFFSRLKGFTKEQVDDEVEKYLNIMELEDDASVITLKLPASTQRKLMVSCALCGNSRVVLLDEPTLDMEPMDKNITWNVLRSEKTGRAIFLTTQFMEETEVLSDRTGILCFGDLKCYGSPFFLKDLYGSGHQLICFKQPECRISRISAILRKYIPNIKPRTIIGEEVTYALPSSHSRFFEHILRDLENKFSDLKLSGFEVTYTTIEEVCLEVPDTHIVGGEKVGTETEDADKPEESEIATSILSRNLRLLKGRRLLLSQWEAMLLKHFLCHIRNRAGLIIKVLFPTVFALLTTCLLATSGQFDPLKPFLIDLYDYDRVTLVLDASDATIQPDSVPFKIQQAYIHNVVTNYVNENPNKFHLEMTGKQAFPEYIMQKGSERSAQSIINAEYLIAASIRKDKIIAWVNNRAIHTQPTTLNFVHNAIARALIGHNKVFKWRIRPLPYTGEQNFSIMQSFENISYSLLMMMAIGLFAVTAVNVVNPIQERVSGAKEIQIRGGVPTSLYWMSLYVWDAVMYINTMVFIVICLEGFALPGFESLIDLLVLVMIFTIFGLVIIPQYYVFSFLFTQPIFGFLIVMISNLSGFVLFLGLLQRSKSSFVEWYWELFSPIAILCALNKICYIAITNDICEDPEISVPKELVCKRLPTCCMEFKYFVWENPGLLSPILCMLANGIGFSLLLWLIESLPFLITKYGPVARMKPDYKEIDPDIHAETQRIVNMTDQHRAKLKLVVDRICKGSKGLVAVKKISFCVNNFECFGLIGPEGAGITNIFKILNGSEKMTRGAAYIKGKNIKTHIQSVYSEIGYCPNFNAFLADLTGRDNLKIFALLRGVPRTHVNMISKELTKVYGITRIQDREADTYSDDNKRKLSVAIAVLGNPSVIYLDEPTKGLDLDGKRHLWAAVCDIREAGKAIVLGSQSMAECKALCTRLAIVVNGEMFCIGAMNHLKERFGQGVVIRIKVNLDSSQHRLFNWMYSKVPGKSMGPSDTRGQYKRNAQDETTQVNLQSVSEVKKYILSKMPGTTLQKEFEEYLTFYMPNRSMKWSEMFSILDQYRRRLFIDRYTISQYTLDLIYQQFAQHQLTKLTK